MDDHANVVRGHGGMTGFATLCGAGAGKVKIGCAVVAGFGAWTAFLVALAEHSRHTRTARLVRGFSLSPAPPRFSQSQIVLALACDGSAAQRIDVPELDVFGEVLDADLSLHFCAGFSEPHYAELGLGALVLEIDDVARFELSADTLQCGATAADGAQAGGLGEGTSVGVHTPDFYGKLDKNALLAAAVHGWLPGLASGMVEGGDGETQVTGVTGRSSESLG